MSDYYKDKTQRSIEQNREPRNVKNIYIRLIHISFHRVPAAKPNDFSSIRKTYMVGGETHSCELPSAFYTCVMHGVHKHRIKK